MAALNTFRPAFILAFSTRIVSILFAVAIIGANGASQSRRNLYLLIWDLIESCIKVQS